MNLIVKTDRLIFHQVAFPTCECEIPCGGMTADELVCAIRELPSMSIPSKDHQTVHIECEYGYENATAVVKYLVEKGFSVGAQSQDKKWTITGSKP